MTASRDDQLASYAAGALGSAVGALLALGTDLATIHEYVDLAAQSRSTASLLAKIFEEARCGGS